MQLKQWIYKGLIAYGMLRTGLFVLKHTKNIINRAIKSFQSLKSIYSDDKRPSWAIVTGGTNGIGLQFVHQLAEQGFNIVLIARKRDVLEKIAQEVGQKYKVETKIIEADLSQGDQPTLWDRIYKEIKDLDIAILVNNVGKYDWSPFDQQKEENIQQLVNMNIYAPTFMTRFVLPIMLFRQKRSAVINIGSFAGESLIPKTAVNCGTKRYVHYFTKCLASEYFDKKIDFLAVVPGFTETRGLDNFKFGKPMLTVNPKDLVKGALRDVKIANQIGNMTTGTFKHALFLRLMNNPLTRGYCIKRLEALNN